MAVMTRVLALIVLALPALAGVLTFPNNICVANVDGSGVAGPCSNWNYISQSYGDAADVDITYKDLFVTTHAQTLLWWDTGYNSLVGVAFGGVSDSPGYSSNRIEIAPLGGSGVTLNGFDLGAYQNAVRASSVRVVELVTGNVLKDYGAVTIGTGNLPVHFSPGVSSANGVAIEWWDSAYNNGIDNIDFSMRNGPAVPEPATFGLLAAGLGLAGALRFRRARG